MNQIIASDALSTKLEQIDREIRNQEERQAFTQEIKAQPRRKSSQLLPMFLILSGIATVIYQIL